MLGLLAESSIHAGTGRNMGVVDLPVAREAATDYPVVVGSSMKGALRDKFENNAELQNKTVKDKCDEDKTVQLVDVSFGKSDRAGGLMVSDARILLLPVRSLAASYKWVTCPHLIERFSRDLKRAGLEPLPSIPTVKRGKALLAFDAGKQQSGSDSIFLEERQFRIAKTQLAANSEKVSTSKQLGCLVEAIEQLIFHEETQKRVSERLVVLHDDDFSWFARYGLSIRARNVWTTTLNRAITCGMRNPCHQIL